MLDPCSSTELPPHPHVSLLTQGVGCKGWGLSSSQRFLQGGRNALELWVKS